MFVISTGSVGVHLKIVLALVSLHLLFSASSFGLAFICVRRTRANDFSPVLAAALWPAFMVDAQSMLGYVRAEQFSAVMALGLITAGVAMTTAVAVRYRQELAALDWKGNIALQFVALFAGLLTLVPHIWNGDFGYSEFSNGEFLNYGQLASFSLGYQHSNAPVFWERMHQGLRDGIDIINATVSVTTRQQPVNAVQLSAALTRAAYFSALLFLLRASVANIAHPTMLTVFIGTMFAFNNLDIFQFEASFMAAGLSLSMVICAAGLVVTNELPRPRALLLYVALNVAMLVTYPEAMIALKMAEAVFVAERSASHPDYEFAKRWLLGNAATVAVNPVLVWRKISYAYEAVMGSGGWNVIAEPLLAPSSYVARIVGLEPIYQSSLALTHDDRIIYGLSAAILASQLGFVALLCWRLRSCTFLLILILITAYHALPWWGYGHFYAAAKLLLAWIWILPLAFAVTFAVAGSTTRVALAAAACLYFTANLETYRRAKTSIVALGTFKSATESRELVTRARAAVDDGGELYLDSEDPTFVQYWLQILDNNGVKVRQSELQARYFARRDDTNRAVTDREPVTRVGLKPNFVFSWKMPNTDLLWNAQPPATDPVYRSHLLSVVAQPVR